MAYAALISLRQTLDGILLQPADLPTMFRDQKQYVEHLIGNLQFLQHFLETYDPSHHKSDETLTLLERKIRDAAYEAQDMVELHKIDSMDYAFSSTKKPQANVQPAVMQSREMMEMDEYVMKLKNGDLKNIVEYTDSIMEEILTFKDRLSLPEIIEEIDPKRIVESGDRDLNSFRTKFGSNDKILMEESDDPLMQIKDELIEQLFALKVISITGMGGIGKTTLAINTYNDPYMEQHFDIRAWVTVSQSYCTKKVILDLLDCMQKLTIELQQKSDDVLMDHLYKILKEKRYLIVMDDIWDTDVWDAVRRAFPDDDNGSRIIITTRITDVATYASSPHSPYQMSLLSDGGSWNLLRAKVFGSESWPFHLQEIGKNIARKCRGLPLSVVVIGGLLSKVNRTYEAWRAVTENMSSFVSSVSDLCSEILKMSYNYLPQHLKSCFLYMGVFPEDCEIYVSKLTRLWIAEGFIDHICNNSLEDAAESYLEELIDRSLISASKKKPNGKIEACRIHDLFLDLCVKEAKCEKILQVSKLHDNPFSVTLMCQRRLSIHSMDVNTFLKASTASSSLVRTLIIMGNYFFRSGVFLRLKLLRVLDVINGVFHQFPNEVLEFLHLRYIALTLEGDIPVSLSKLYNLQTLIIRQSIFRSRVDEKYIPFEIWKMARLRHIILIGDYVIAGDAHEFDFHGNEFVLEELQTISGIRNLGLTKELLRSISNIRKLDLVYDTSCCRLNEFENLASLCHLKELEIFIDLRWSDYWDRPPRLKLGFPRSLETLTLSGCGIPWNDLSIVGSLPHLQVLKLKHDACVGKEWEPNEDEFCQLKHLELEGLELMNWDCEHHHFPALEHIIVRQCYKLVEIPFGMGESPTLTIMELHGCQESAFDSAFRIQETQKNLGNDGFQVVHSNKFVCCPVRKACLKSSKRQAEMRKLI